MLPSGQLDPDQTGGHCGAAQAREVLRQDLQRNLPLHPQYMRGLRVIPVSLLPILQRRTPHPVGHKLGPGGSSISLPCLFQQCHQPCRQ